MNAQNATERAMVARFSAYLFWDIDRAQLDIQKYSAYVIGRVLSHGMLSDWFLIKEIYGKETIRQVALQQRHLDKQALAFCSAYFDEPLTNFRCYQLAQSNPEHWDY